MSTEFLIVVAGKGPLQSVKSSAEEVVRTLVSRGCEIAAADVHHGDPANRQREAVTVVEYRRTQDVAREARETMERDAAERVRAKRPGRKPKE